MNNCLFHHHERFDFQLTEVSYSKRRCRGKREITAAPWHILSYSCRPHLWSKLTGFQNRFHLMWNLLALLRLHAGNFWSHSSCCKLCCTWLKGYWLLKKCKYIHDRKCIKGQQRSLSLSYHFSLAMTDLYWQGKDWFKAILLERSRNVNVHIHKKNSESYLPIILLIHSVAGTAALWWPQFRKWNLFAISTAPDSWGPRASPSAITHLVVAYNSLSNFYLNKSHTHSSIQVGMTKL